ncbi:MAG: BtpA/SgcQ family protein [Candidatus Obscuribacterales bacterium]|nr:BtpA/SgcQ family protein [Candidatus Obscuribacterales bacterium]
MWNRKCSLIGMVHLLPLPGSADYGGSVDTIIDLALREAVIYKSHGFDAVMLENMHDLPYLRGTVDPETTAAMAVTAHRVKAQTQLPLGIQLLAAANIEALGAAIAASADFIRVEGYVFAHVGDEGLHQSCAPQLIRKRAQLKAERIQIFADIKKKHSAHALTSDISLVDTAKAAEFFKADGVIVTGHHTGNAPESVDVTTVRNAVACKVLVGSGVDETNIAEFMTNADALIVGSSLKEGGRWQNPLQPQKVAALAQLCSR